MLRRIRLSSYNRQIYYEYDVLWCASRRDQSPWRWLLFNEVQLLQNDFELLRQYQYRQTDEYMCDYNLSGRLLCLEPKADVHVSRQLHRHRQLQIPNSKLHEHQQLRISRPKLLILEQLFRAKKPYSKWGWNRKLYCCNHRKTNDWLRVTWR